MSDNLYLFVSTKNKKILDKLNSLEGKHFLKRFSDSEESSCLFTDHEREYPYYLSVINDQQDYAIEKEIQSITGSNGVPSGSDSLVSFAHIIQDHFVARTDFWGIQHHYYYNDGESFICSNNIFIIAKLVNAKFSETSLFEYYFFYSPLKSNTWFENIHLLSPNQAISYNMKSKHVALSPELDLYDELTGNTQNGDLIGSVTSFYQNASKSLQGRKALISLSSGSDSRTVLSGLLKFDLVDKAVSWGRKDFEETKAIEDLCEKFKIKSVIHEFSHLLSDWDETFINASALTNGLLNPFRVHYANYYNSLEGHALFEGILGSEFVKGEISLAMTSPYHRQAITNNASIREIIEANFAFLPKEMLSKMEQYIADTYSPTLKSLNTSEGKREYARHLLHFVPSKIFSAVILLAKMNLKVYYPFLSPRILKEVFRSFGIVKYSKFDKSFPGPIKCLVPEAEIVRSFHGELYRSVLDRSVSFKEALEKPVSLSRLLMRLRKLKKRIVTSKLHSGQVDSEQIRLAAKPFIEATDVEMYSDFFGGALTDENPLKEHSNLICLGKILKQDSSNFSLLRSRKPLTAV